MTATSLFYIIIGILILNFIIDKILDALNAKHFNDPIPIELNDVYDTAEYEKSQRYKKERYRFGILTSSVSIIATLLFFFLDGFEFVDQMARGISSNEIVIALLFFGIIMFANDILSTPFAYYNTFVIEERFGLVDNRICPS